MYPRQRTSTPAGCEALAITLSWLDHYQDEPDLGALPEIEKKENFRSDVEDGVPGRKSPGAVLEIFYALHKKVTGASVFRAYASTKAFFGCINESLVAYVSRWWHTMTTGHACSCTLYLCFLVLIQVIFLRNWACCHTWWDTAQATRLPLLLTVRSKSAPLHAVHVCARVSLYFRACVCVCWFQGVYWHFGARLYFGGSRMSERQRRV